MAEVRGSKMDFFARAPKIEWVINFREASLSSPRTKSHKVRERFTVSDAAAAAARALSPPSTTEFRLRLPLCAYPCQLACLPGCLLALPSFSTLLPAHANHIALTHSFQVAAWASRDPRACVVPSRRNQVCLPGTLRPSRLIIEPEPCSLCSPHGSRYVSWHWCRQQSTRRKWLHGT